MSDLGNQLLVEQLNATLNQDNTIDISLLNENYQVVLRSLEAGKNKSLELKNIVKTLEYEKLQQQYPLLIDIFNKLKNQELDKIKIFSNYKDKIIKGKYTNANEAIKIIDEILDAYDEMEEIRNSLYKTINNKKIGTLSQLALNALPKTEEEFKNKLTESFGENTDIDSYMSVYDFEKNKDKLQKEYNPANSSSGGRKTKRRRRNKSKSKKIKTKRYMKTISNLKRRTKHYKR
jgi:hypothetical protein